MEPRLRLAEPLAALSVATDMARGRAPGQALRASAVATRLAAALGLTRAERATTYFASLLRFAGCTATSHEYALHLGGNDIAARFGGDSIDPADAAQLGGLLSSLGAAGAPPASVMQIVAEGSRADCEVGARLAVRLGLGSGVGECLLHIFERWDGHGLPNGVAGDGIPLPARIGAVANTAVMFHESGGRTGALSTIEDWSGGILDPAVARTFVDHADDMFAVIEEPDAWESGLAAEPEPHRTAGDEDLDGVCHVFADFVDLKTPFLLGHSSRVANLAEAAARRLGLPEDGCTTLRRAGLLHDLGRVGVSTGIWEKAPPLSTLDEEQIRLHPYRSERILERCAPFQPLARLAGMHHERMDGSGYYRGLGASALDRAARILAAADACAELIEDRPGRPALSLDTVAAQLAQQRLDPDCVRVVLDVVGAKYVRPAVTSAHRLTAREVEVIRLLARGLTLDEIGAHLHISASTAHTHAAHIYEKASVSTRAGAALFAMEHGLLG